LVKDLAGAGNLTPVLFLTAMGSVDGIRNRGAEWREGTTSGQALFALASSSAVSPSCPRPQAMEQEPVLRVQAT